MAREVTSLIGSGTVPFTGQILTPDGRGTNLGGRGERYGTQVQIANPEDLNSVAAFGVSGVTVGVTPVQLVGPTLHVLPRTRTVILQVFGAADEIFFGPSESTDFLLQGFSVLGSTAGEIRSVELPFLHNVSIWARTASGTADVRILIY